MACWARVSSRPARLQRTGCPIVQPSRQLLRIGQISVMAGLVAEVTMWISTASVEAAVVYMITSATIPAEMATSLALLVAAVAAVAALLRACWPQAAAPGRCMCMGAPREPPQ